MSEKDEIILAIAFIKAYPTVESYLQKNREFDKISDGVLSLTFENLQQRHRNEWNEKKAISDVAIANGYKTE